jgi:hypothetical protein
MNRTKVRKTSGSTVLPTCFLEWALTILLNFARGYDFEFAFMFLLSGTVLGWVRVNVWWFR